MDPWNYSIPLFYSNVLDICCYLIGIVRVCTLLTQPPMCRLQQKPLLNHLDKSTSCPATASQSQEHPVNGGLRLALVSICQHIAAVVDHDALGHEEGELWCGMKIFNARLDGNGDPPTNYPDGH